MISPRLTAAEALGAFVLAMLLMLGFTGVSYALLGLAALVVIQIVFIAGPALFLAAARGGVSRVAAYTVGMRPAGRLAIAGGVLIGCSFWYLNLAVVAPIGERYLGGHEFAQKLEHTILGGRPLWLTMLVVSVFPALCEELLMRGALTRALVPRFGRVGAVVLGAMLFGAMHLHPAQMLPTFVFGLVLGYAVVATDSVWPGVAMHLCNNLMVLFIGGQAIPSLTASLRQSPELWLPIAGFLSVCGTLLIRTSGNPHASISTATPS